MLDCSLSFVAKLARQKQKIHDHPLRRHSTQPRTGNISGGRTCPQPIPEKPVRIDMLMKGVRYVGSHVETPPPIGDDLLALVHDQRYLTFLETLRERWGHVPELSDIPLPNVYAIQRASLPPIGYPEAVVGQAGVSSGRWRLSGHGHHDCRGQGQCCLCRRRGEAHRGRRAARVCIVPPAGTSRGLRPRGPFRFFNNAALAAEMLTRSGHRTAILDIDAPTMATALKPSSMTVPMC